MKVHLTVEIDDKDGRFFADLISGGYAWASSATLNITGNIDSPPPPVDATWLLRSNVSIEPSEQT